MNQLKQIELLSEEFEALRLADQLDLSQQDAAEQMGVSRQTFGNIVKKARFKVATCLVEGSALVLEEQVLLEEKVVSELNQAQGE